MTIACLIVAIAGVTGAIFTPVRSPWRPVAWAFGETGFLGAAIFEAIAGDWLATTFASVSVLVCNFGIVHWHKNCRTLP